MKLRDIVYGIGGGIRDGKKFKAVQTAAPRRLHSEASWILRRLRELTRSLHDGPGP